MSDCCPSPSSYETAPTSPLGTIYNSNTPIRFAPRGTKSSITDEIVVLGPRNIQQWLLDVASARVEGTTNKLEAPLDKIAAEILEISSEVALLSYQIDADIILLKNDLKKAQRRRRALLLCVLALLAWFLWSWIFERGARGVFELFDFGYSEPSRVLGRRKGNGWKMW